MKNKLVTALNMIVWLQLAMMSSILSTSAACAAEPSLPAKLYHATPIENAINITEVGLQPRSGPDADKYISMSGKETGATTLSRKASDVVFRVKSNDLDKTKWKKQGAGSNEWRGTESIDKSSLEYCFFTGKNGAAFKKIDEFKTEDKVKNYIQSEEKKKTKAK
jgi:hypothetical protein